MVEILFSGEKCPKMRLKINWSVKCREIPGSCLLLFMGSWLGAVLTAMMMAIVTRTTKTVIILSSNTITLHEHRNRGRPQDDDFFESFYEL